LPPANSEAPEVLTLFEIARRYEGKWVLVKILDSSLPRRDAPGIVLAHGPNDQRMTNAVLKAHKREPEAHLTVMLGGVDQFGDGDTLRRALARIAAQGEFVSVNPW
jgi:hypothetical protein